MDRFLVVTSNLGSVFENDCIEQAWLEEFEKLVSEADPDVLALHLQEVGGKDYELCMPKVDKFIRKFRNLKCFSKFDRCRGFIDTSFKAIDDFTALGNLYLFHSRMGDVCLWDFKDKSFTTVKGDKVLMDELLESVYCQKERFPNGYYPDVKWSRKGYLHSRWRIHNKTVNFVNIHLFHDDDNLIALEKSPSVYCEYRRKGLMHTLKGVTRALGGHLNEPVFAFGDFNFRLDFSAVMKGVLSRNRQAHFVRAENGAVNKVVVYRDSDEANPPAITVERKKFIMKNGKQFREDFAELMQYDTELKSCEQLMELPIQFQPSYPFSEEVEEGSSYMDKRCPAWCDRIVMTSEAHDLVKSSPTGSTYDMAAKERCVGDHKPIYMFFSVPSDSASKPHSAAPNWSPSVLVLMGALIGLAALSILLHQW